MSGEHETHIRGVGSHCATCHNDDLMVGNFSLSDVDLDEPASHAEALEKVVLKLRAGMMPPPGTARPAGDSLTALVESLEARPRNGGAQYAFSEDGTLVYVRSQGLYYDTFVSAQELPMKGPFQKFEAGETDFGPGDRFLGKAFFIVTHH